VIEMEATGDEEEADGTEAAATEEDVLAAGRIEEGDFTGDLTRLPYLVNNKSHVACGERSEQTETDGNGLD
jgi:hypothetical protein